MFTNMTANPLHRALGVSGRPLHRWAAEGRVALQVVGCQLEHQCRWLGVALGTQDLSPRPSVPLTCVKVAPPSPFLGSRQEEGRGEGLTPGGETRVLYSLCPSLAHGNSPGECSQRALAENQNPVRGGGVDGTEGSGQGDLVFWPVREAGEGSGRSCHRRLWGMCPRGRVQSCKGPEAGGGWGTGTVTKAGWRGRSVRGSGEWPRSAFSER